MTRKMNRKRERERERKRERGRVWKRRCRINYRDVKAGDDPLCRGEQQDWTARSATMAYDACSHGAGTVEQDPDERP